MAVYKKSLQIPVLIGSSISIGILTTLWLLREWESIEWVLTIILLVSLAIFLCFVVYVFIAQILLLFKKSIWLSGIPIALIIYFGVLIISLSYFKELVDKIQWNVSMAGLGVAIVAVGLSFLSRYESSQPEEALRQLKAHSDDLGAQVNALEKTQSNIKSLTSSVVKESQKFIDSLTKIIEDSSKKDD